MHNVIISMYLILYILVTNRSSEAHSVTSYFKLCVRSSEADSQTCPVLKVTSTTRSGWSEHTARYLHRSQALHTSHPASRWDVNLAHIPFVHRQRFFEPQTNAYHSRVTATATKTQWSFLHLSLKAARRTKPSRKQLHAPYKIPAAKELVVSATERWHLRKSVFICTT